MFPYQAAYSFHGAVLSKSLSFKYIKSVTPRGPGNMVLVDLHVNDVIHLFSFLFGCAGSSLLCSLVVAQELLIAVTSLIAEHSSGARGLSGCGAYGLRCPVVRGLLPDRGRNPRPVHWRADSQPLGHQESLPLPFFPKPHFLIWETQRSRWLGPAFPEDRGRWLTTADGSLLLASGAAPLWHS